MRPRFPECIGMLVAVHLAGPVAAAELPSPQALVARSIEYHDPAGVWSRDRVELEIHTVYSPELARTRGYTESRLRLTLAPGQELFRYESDRGGRRIVYSLVGGVGQTTVDGETEVSPEQREELRLGTPESYRDYCEYVYGMPMKLLDPGTLLGKEVRQTRFGERDALVLRVTYDPEVGSDVWDFYFDPSSFALVGYRFFHDETLRDGEFIVFDGEVSDAASGMRIPRHRAWYYNSNGGHLATDSVTAVSVTAADR